MTITASTALPVEIELVDGRKFAKVGDVEAYLRDLSHDQHTSPHWHVAVRMFANAIREPSYLKAATLSFKTALALDGLMINID